MKSIIGAEGTICSEIEITEKVTGSFLGDYTLISIQREPCCLTRFSAHYITVHLQINLCALSACCQTLDLQKRKLYYSSDIEYHPLVITYGPVPLVPYTRYLKI